MKSVPRKDHRGVDLISDALQHRARIVFDCWMTRDPIQYVIRLNPGFAAKGKSFCWQTQ
jgi:hypothetical protein